MLSKFKKINSGGYNRIEVLVLMGVIISCIIVGLIGFLEVQKQLRDSKRRADIGVIAGSLELHYNSKLNQFCEDGQIGSYCHPNSNWFQGGLPLDPLWGDYINLPKDGDKNYLICAKLEGVGGNSINKIGDPARDQNGNYYCQKNQQ